jgi:hypothetical protein
MRPAFIVKLENITNAGIKLEWLTKVRSAILSLFHCQG